jgi:hypothetical protein
MPHLTWGHTGLQESKTMGELEQFTKGLSMGIFYAGLESVPTCCLNKYGSLVDPLHEDWGTTDFSSERDLDTAIELYRLRQEQDK